MARSRKTTKKAKPKKAGGKKLSSASSTGNGGGNTMIKVMRANDGKPLGYYNNKARADHAMGDKRVVERALKKKGVMKGVVGADGLFKVEEVHNCTESEGPTALGMQEGKWKMNDHAPGPGSGSSRSRVGGRLGNLLNKSSNTKINGDEGGRTIGDAFKPIRYKGKVCDGLAIYDGNLFAGLMAVGSLSRLSGLLKGLRKKGSNKASRRMDNGKKGHYPQYWFIDGLRPGLENYSDFRRV